MALDVGELVARLTLDDDRFTRNVQNAQQQSQRLNQQLGTIDTAARRASQQLGQIELNRGLDRMAEQAAQQVRQLSENAQRAGRSTEQIELDDRLLRDARNAANQIEELRRSAQRAGDQVGELGNELDDVADGAGGAGEQAGGNFLSGFSDAIGNLASKTGPIAGSILGVAALGLAAGGLLAAAIKDGLDQELSRDLFQTQTGVTEAQARKFALAAGEAFSDAFGESVESNLSTLKLALQNNVIDPGSTQQAAQKVVADLESISAALDGEVAISVKAVSALMSTGLATSAQEAADMIANAVGGSANKGEDLLEVIWEYSAGWKNAGISAEAALAMIEQATDNGAWNADAPGDALREFGRRVTEEGETIVETLNDIGLNGEEMYKAFQRGGDDGFEAFDKFFDKIRGMEDPVKRNAAIMGLLGDTSGDFIDVFAKWDPSEALKNFGEFEGAASDLAGTLGGNAATSVQGAMNSITVVADGFKAALAEAFGPYIADFADNISNNRAGVISFFIDVGNVAFDGAEAVLGFVSGGMEGLAEFAEASSEMAGSVLDSVAGLVRGLDALLGPFDELIPGLPNLGNVADDIEDFAKAAKDGGQDVADGLRKGSEFIDNTLAPSIENARGRFNEFAGDMKNSAAYNDEIAKVAKAIGDVGTAADGSTMDLDGWIGVFDDRRIPELEDGIKNVVGQLESQTRAGLEAGESIEALTAQYGSNRDAMIEQLMALGMTNDMAVQYINSLGMTPELINTQINQPGMPEAHSALDVLNDKIIDTPDEKSIHTYALTDDAVDDLEALGLKVERLPDGTVNVTADTDEGESIIEAWRTRRRTVEVQVRVAGMTDAANRMAGNIEARTQAMGNADGSITQFANGGLVGPAPDQALISQQVPGGINQWAEAGPEAYIPLSESKRKRSEAILKEVARRFGLGVVRLGRDQLSEMFMGDPKSLTDRTDPTGWRALLGGDFNGKLSRFGIEEDSPLVDAVLSARKAIVDGDFDGNLTKFGIEEDSPIARALLGLNRHVIKMANGGVVEGMSDIVRSKFPALTITDSYRPGANDNHGAGLAIDVSNGSGNTDEQLAFANWVADNYPNSRELIYDDPRFNRQIKNGSFVDKDFYAGAGDHTHHVHWAMSEAPGAPMGRIDREKLNADIEQALADELNATTPEEREAAAKRLQALQSQRDTLVGTTDGGVGLATDGQRVFVTNWPGGYSPSKTSSSSADAAPEVDSGQGLIPDGFKHIADVRWKGFANGGIEDHRPQIAPPGAWRVWAEPETGGEAYIPLGEAKRPGAVGVLRTVADRFGFGLVEMADGGLTGSGFGGYLTPRKTAGGPANLAELGLVAAGLATFVGSGFDSDGTFTGDFSTGSNSIPFLDKRLADLEDAIKKGGAVGIYVGEGGQIIVRDLAELEDTQQQAADEAARAAAQQIR